MSTTPTLEAHAHTHDPNRYAVIPTARRLGLDRNPSGRGVTIALIDSGFVEHADLDGRVVAHVDLTGAQARCVGVEGWMWHGTQTSVVAAGNGALSRGLYRGLAWESRVVLVNVSDGGRIGDADIVRGLEWVRANREKYAFGVVNVSLGGDVDVAHAESAVDRAAEALVADGVVVVVAAGNAGCSADHSPLPPANAPSVITVGGYDDGNRLADALEPYCSSYGLTLDGLLKPEVVAPAIWVAAPIVPETADYRRAVALSEIDSTPDALLDDLPDTVWREAGLPPHAFLGDVEELREQVAIALRELKIVAAHYQHVDGTSFAAPIVASIAALMLEVNPDLTPSAVKSILMSTADRIPGVPVERQGYGVVNARRAVDLARNERHALAGGRLSRPPFCDGGTLVFLYHDDAASSVFLAGDFNEWNATATRFVRERDGMWRAEILPPSSGRYRYKLVVDSARWLDDPGNSLREHDGFGGFNSIVVVRDYSIDHSRFT